MFIFAPTRRIMVSAVLSLLPFLPVDGQENVVISEFMASNTRTRADVDGTFSDWIEVQNAGSLPVNLAGWYLTDNSSNPAKWQFPAVALAPGAKVLVFASEKNRNNAGQELHTNFKLASGGEYLALVKPDGATVSHSYAPVYPVQI